MSRAAPQQLELELTRREPRSPRKRRSTEAAAARLLEMPDALLTRSHLRALGPLPVVALPGYSRPMIRVCDYAELIAKSTYRGDRVRPSASTVRRLRVG